MIVADAIEAFLKQNKDKHYCYRAMTRAEIIAGVSEGTPRSRTNALLRLADAGKIRRIRGRRGGRLTESSYRWVKSREWCAADQKLVERREQQEREALVVRRCMCCQTEFETDQAYRLCKECRSEEITTYSCVGLAA